MQSTAPRKAVPQRRSRLALPGWAALWERLCRGGRQQDGHRPTKERMWDQGLFNQRERELQGDHTAAAWYVQGGHGEDGARLCSAPCGGRTRGNRHTLKPEGFETGYREILSPCEDSNWSDRLSGEAVQPPSLEVLQTCPDKAQQPGLASRFCPGGWMRVLLGFLPA